MKRNLLLAIAVILIVVGLFFLTKAAEIFLPRGQGALQVITNTKSNIYLDNKHVGITPFCKCKQNETLNTGEYMLKIEPQDKSFNPFSAKIKVEKGVLTVVERTFLPESLSSAYILTLEKLNNSSTAQMSISSLPDSAMVTVDGLPSGATPHDIKSISASEHEVEIQKSGFSKKTLRVRTVEGYTLVINAVLGTTSSTDTIILPTVNPTNLTPTPGTSEISPTKKAPLSAKTVLILQTPNGFLRVREEPSTSTAEVARVKPGETYDVLEEQSGWYKISTSDGIEGWISGTYAQKN